MRVSGRILRVRPLAVPSMHEVVRLAIQERIARQEHADRVQRAARRVAEQHREILDRLKNA